MPRKKTDTTSSETEKPKAKKTKATSPTKAKTSKKTSGKFSPKETYLKIRQNISANKNLYLRYLVITLVVVAIGAFLFFKKNWFVVAVVNNQPITSVEYYQNLKAKDSKQVLNQIIRDRLITQEANRQGVIISQEEMNKKMDEIKKQLGGDEELKQALESRGITETEFQNQIRVQLIVEKLLADEIKVSDKDVEEYIAKNKDSAVLGVDTNDKEAVREQLQNEKLNEKFQSWYENLQKNARILTFI